jgi:hypothetical protein
MNLKILSRGGEGSSLETLAALVMRSERDIHTAVGLVRFAKEHGLA